ncbi:Cbp80/20-dependent translation initiation factor [Plakobranchus ocellatus]|uniref:Cbp80/20-dependent translation initiation factor n=1 Tax=Plakobranchus ocellatus TaxID=259542 RepID=A0AAV4DV13_9GAST|nr:Cbp80/20-dependent translation initiation factor [Plakobranchus ocellatus]
MAGRGRGRGRSRGILDMSTTSPGGLQDKQQDGENQDAQGDASSRAAADTNSLTNNSQQATLSLEDMKSILEDTRTYSENSDSKRVLMCARNFVRTADDVKTLASLIYNKCLKDCSLAKRGSEICNSLTSIEVGGVQFRSCLLSLVQADYTARNELMKENPSRFNGFTAFLCEVFGVMRTNTNEVFKPLVGPIFDCFNLVLGPEPEEGSEQADEFDVDEDACENLAIQIQCIGRLLEEHGEDQLTHLMDRIRTCIINSKSPARVRCCLLEVVEAYARGWESASSHTAQFYCDTAVGIISGLIL